MGAGGSKAAARTYQAAAAGAKAAQRGAPATAPPATGALARDAAGAAAARGRPPLTLEEEEALEAQEAKDAGLDQLLARLGGAVHGKRVDVAPPPQASPALGAAQLQSSEGRLPPDALRQLFELQAAAGGAEITPGHEITKYKPDADLMRRVLARACLPQSMEAQGASNVQVFSSWPAWFRRAPAGQ